MWANVTSPYYTHPDGMLVCSILPDTQTPVRGAAPTRPPLPPPKFNVAGGQPVLSEQRGVNTTRLNTGNIEIGGKGGTNDARRTRCCARYMKCIETEAPDAAQVHDMLRLMHKMFLVCTRCQ